MSDLEAKAEEIRQMILKLEEWYGQEDYVSVFKSLADGRWLAGLTNSEGGSLYLPHEARESGKWAEGDFKPTIIEALESLREKLAPFVKDEE